MTCTHWQDCGVIGGGCCKINAYAKPSLGICMKVCMMYDGPPRGLGDVVAKVTKAVGIKPCVPCRERQAAMNRAIPFKKGNP